jgi:Trk K+ transport system NAD-binding subunit
MDKQIAIIGAGQDKKDIAEFLANQGYNEVLIITQEEYEEYVNDPFKRATHVYTIEAPKIVEYVEVKEFICKERHQYREVEGKWICQCGRVL